MIVPVITLPRLHSQDTELVLMKNVDAGDMLNTWHSLEKIVKDTVSGQDSVSLQSTCQPVFNNTTSNNLQPRAVVGETVYVKVKMENLTEDEKYRRMRLQNNDASKRCREKRKRKQQDMEEELIFLQDKNHPI